MNSLLPMGASRTVSPRAGGGRAVLPTQTSWPRGLGCGGWLPLVFHTRVELDVGMGIEFVGQQVVDGSHSV